MIGVACYFFMPDTPQLSGRWLEPDEIRYLTIQTDIREGGKYREAAEKFSWRDVRALVTDYKVYLQMWILFATTTCSYG